eukprot:TRINITY_DN1345_c0_g1_i2.p2 TRINITY_DN1345_c0_g1~~TRINITY_DN1345_c0_g1_i2.p2  ORF type:complete len:135 (+),score=4.03 TRINITY_DN1345_c0_g1_i2:137-541(+)
MYNRMRKEAEWCGYLQGQYEDMVKGGANFWVQQIALCFQGLNNFKPYRVRIVVKREILLLVCYVFDKYFYFQGIVSKDNKAIICLFYIRICQLGLFSKLCTLFCPNKISSVVRVFLIYSQGQRLSGISNGINKE